MANAALTQDDLKALEQARQRLYQLSNSLASLKENIARNHPLPQWESLQSSAAILVGTTQGITDTLSRHTEFLNRIVVYPSTNYPGRTQENILTQLLRKKLEPPVETLVEQGRAAATADQAESNIQTGSEEELWDWADEWIHNRTAVYAKGEGLDDFTIDERARGLENVNTGLRRKLDRRIPRDTSDDDEDEDNEDDDDEDDEDEDDEEMPDVRPEFGMGKVHIDASGKSRTEDDILRYVTSGVMANTAASAMNVPGRR